MRTPAFRALRRVARAAGRALRLPSENLTRPPRPTRRQLLRGLLGTGAALALPSAAGGCASDGEVLVVGGGLAGLTAAYRIARAGRRVTLVEARDRLGGRVETRRDVGPDRQFVELGGEFVDAGHANVRFLASELGLKVQSLDDGSAGEELFAIDGAVYAANDLVGSPGAPGAFVELAARIAADQEALYDNEGYFTPRARELDQISLADYLAAASDLAPAWVLELLAVSYTCAYGLDAGELSALCLIDLIGTDIAAGFAMYGESDEGARIEGGSDRLVDALRDRLQGNADLRLGETLRKISMAADGTLAVHVETAGRATTTELRADQVVLTLPMPCLRDVEGLDALEISPDKLRMWREATYGTNAKVLQATRGKPWRAATAGFPAPSEGSFTSDLPFMQAWDATLAQPGEGGVLTAFLGGAAGLTVDMARRAAVLGSLQEVIPGLRFDERYEEVKVWAEDRFSKGSYWAQRPGQYTFSIPSLARSELDGQLLFAGEHTSDLWQGYMEGAVESGERAAEEIVGTAPWRPGAR